MLLEKPQMRKIETLHEGFAQALHTHYSEIKDVVVDSEIAFVDFTTLGEVIASLSNPSVSYSYAIDGLTGQAMIDYAPHVAKALVGADRTDSPLVESERAAMARILTRDLGDLMSAWSPIQSLEAKDAQLETNPEELVKDTARNSAVVLVAFEINGPDFSGLIRVYYLYDAIQPLIPALEAWAPAS